MTNKEFIIRQVAHLQEYHNIGIKDIDEVVDVFFKVLEYKINEKSIDGVGERIKSCIDSLNEGVNNAGLLQVLTTINLTEVYAKKVLYIVDSQALEDIEAKLKGYFVVLEELGFSGSQTGQMRERRNNEGSHKCDAELSMEEIYGRINRFLLDYLIITNWKIDELKKVVVCEEETAFFPDIYISKLIKTYEKEESERYLDVHWHGEDDSSVDCNIDGILDNNSIWGNKTYGVKFLGEAGTGKTTALKRIQYRIAKQYKEKQSEKIPVYVSLSELNQDNGALMSKICEITQLNRANVQEHMYRGDFVILLDGYNEILDSLIQRNVAKEIDGYIRVNYQMSKIYLSDRTITRNSIPVMSDAFKLYLREISLAEKLDFLKKRIPEDCYEIVRQKSDENEDYFRQFNTPLKLENLAKVIKNERRIPEDVISSYINMLFEREKNENKEIGMDAIEDLLRALAIYIYNSVENDDESISSPTIGRIKAMSILASVKNMLGYNIEPEHFERVTKGMLLLNWENNCVGFTSREYLSYFMFEGIELGIEEIVMQLD